jgi:hypothetical protein
MTTKLSSTIQLDEPVVHRGLVAWPPLWGFDNDRVDELASSIRSLAVRGPPRGRELSGRYILGLPSGPGEETG